MRSPFIVVSVASLAAVPARADLIDGGLRVYPLAVFENTAGVSVGELSLHVEVWRGAGTLDLTVRNDSTIPSIIGAVYLEATSVASNSLLNPRIAAQSAGVTMSFGATPPRPPGAIDLVGGPWAGNLTALRRQGRASNGIDPGEWLTVRFDEIVPLPTGTAFPSRLVAHVQGLSGDASVWAVTVPSPASGTLGLTGTLAILCGGRRRQR